MSGYIFVRVALLEDALELEKLGYPQEAQYAWSAGRDPENAPVLVEWDADAEQLGCKLCAAPKADALRMWYAGCIGRKRSTPLFAKVSTMLDLNRWHEVTL